MRYTRKFMMALSNKNWRPIKKQADEKGISIQELLRADVIPWWLKTHRKEAKAASGGDKRK